MMELEYKKALGLLVVRSLGGSEVQAILSAPMAYKINIVISHLSHGSHGYHGHAYGPLGLHIDGRLLKTKPTCLTRTELRR